MSQFDLIGVAIGLVFVYLLLSILCTALAEMFEVVMRFRATDLERGIREMLSRTPPPTGSQSKAPVDEWVLALYAHPLIRSMYKGVYSGPPGLSELSERHHLPSYLPGRDFTLVLLDLVARAQKEGTTDGPFLERSPQALLKVSELREAVFKIQNETIKDALLPLIDAGEQSIESVRSNVEAWFDATMDRVSGWYKRRVQVVLLVLGVLVAIAMNADSIAIFTSLTRNRDVRDAMVEAASRYVAENQGQFESAAGASPQASSRPAASPSPSASGTPAASASPNPECAGSTSPVCRVFDDIDAIQQFGLPIGWSKQTTPTKPVDWLLRIVGWLLTAFALTLGAPFWFDILNKLVSIRATGRPEDLRKK